MKIRVLIFLAMILAAAACSSKEPTTNSNANSTRTVRTIATPKTTGDNRQSETVDEQLLLTTIQNYIAENYPGWTLKGTERLESSYINLHIIKTADEKIIKISYKNFTELNGQPYLVITKISETDLNKQIIEEEKQKNETISNGSAISNK